MTFLIFVLTSMIIASGIDALPTGTTHTHHHRNSTSGEVHPDTVVGDHAPWDSGHYHTVNDSSPDILLYHTHVHHDDEDNDADERHVHVIDGVKYYIKGSHKEEENRTTHVHEADDGDIWYLFDGDHNGDETLTKHMHNHHHHTDLVDGDHSEDEKVSKHWHETGAFFPGPHIDDESNDVTGTKRKRRQAEGSEESEEVTSAESKEDDTSEESLEHVAGHSHEMGEHMATDHVAGDGCVEVTVKKIPSPYVLFNESNTDWPGAIGLGAFGFEGKLNVWGGEGKSGDLLPSKYIWIFDPSMATWTREETTGDIPDGRFIFPNTFLDGKFYVMGGHGEAQKGAYAYNPLTKVWKKMSDMPEIRRTGCSWSYGNSVYVFGGDIGRFPELYSNDVLRLNVASNEWSKIITSGTVPSSRKNMGCSRSGDRLVMYGGTNGTFLSDVYILNLTTLVWEPVTIPKFYFRKMRSMTVDFVSPRLVLVIGGDIGGFGIGEYNLFDVMTKSIVKSGHIDKGISHHSTAIIGDKLYVIGDRRNDYILEFMVGPTK